MHELSVAVALLEQIGTVARERQVKRVISADLVVGTLAGVDPEALQFAFEIASRDSAADGCRLAIRTVRPTLRCRACGVSSPAESSFAVCPGCGATDVVIEGGRELHLQSVEIEE